MRSIHGAWTGRETGGGSETPIKQYQGFHRGGIDADMSGRDVGYLRL